jgi:hypothetical protein
MHAKIARGVGKRTIMNSAPHVPRWVPVKFETATVSPSSTAGSYVLAVSGNTPSSGERSLGARLVADRTYIDTPDYWEVLVEWDTAGAILMAMQPYHVSIQLDGKIGTKGIEVIGQNQSQKIDVP